MINVSVRAVPSWVFLEQGGRCVSCTLMWLFWFRMNGLSLSELCCLFCCPPCPSRIAAKLAFLPPDPSYTFLPDPEAGTAPPCGPQAQRSQTGAAAAGGGSSVAAEGRWKLHLADRADFQYGQAELDMMEVLYTRSSRGNRIGCMFIRCAPNAR